MAKFHLDRISGIVSPCIEGSSFPEGEPGLYFPSEEAANTFYQMISPEILLQDSIETPEEYLVSETRMRELAMAGDWQGLQSFVSERSDDPRYLKLLKERAQLQRKLDKLADTLVEPARKSKLVTPAVAVPATKELRGLTLEYRDCYEELAYTISLMTQYRILSARAAYAASALREAHERETNTFISYEEETLGELVAGGEFPINSPEWHAARAGGIGGSDVGAIMRVDAAFGSQNYARVVASKLGLDDPADDPLAETRDDLTSAIGRGNAWEEYIRYMVQDRNPELRVAFCKTSWHGAGETSYRHANFDGLFLDEFGKPEGILEIKTGSNPRKWGEPKRGLKAVPPGYRKQVLWYAANAGLKYGMIVALLDDNDYREYHFSMEDPEIQAEVTEMYEATDAFWKTIQEKRAELASGVAVRTQKWNRLGARESIDSIAEVYSGYSGDSKPEARKRIVDALAKAQGPEKRELSREEFQRVVFSVFCQHDPATRKRPLVGIDIETTTTSPRTGRIIETGIVTVSEGGEPEIVYSSLHGVPARALSGVGVGAVNVHHITEDRIIGKEPFEAPETQAAILALLKDSTMVAHNAGFEDRFLAANLPGYIEAKAAGEIVILDTRKVAKYLMPRSSDNSLQSFAEDNGIPYLGAHAAAQDSLMMMQALLRLQRTLFSGGRFITRRASSNARMNAAKAAEALESDR